MADEKFSQFPYAGDQNASDIVVGLREGINAQFNAATKVIFNNVIYIANNGTSEANGADGSLSKPFETFIQAAELIEPLAPSSQNTFLVMDMRTTSEITLTDFYFLIPWVSYVGNPACEINGVFGLSELFKTAVDNVYCSFGGYQSIGLNTTYRGKAVFNFDATDFVAIKFYFHDVNAVSWDCDYKGTSHNDGGVDIVEYNFNTYDPFFPTDSIITLTGGIKRSIIDSNWRHSSITAGTLGEGDSILRVLGGGYCAFDSETGKLLINNASNNSPNNILVELSSSQTITNDVEVLFSLANGINSNSFYYDSSFFAKYTLADGSVDPTAFLNITGSEDLRLTQTFSNIIPIPYTNSAGQLISFQMLGAYLNAINSALLPIPAAVTQSTSITTDVTLNAVEGIITTVSSTLAGLTSTSFTLNNSKITSAMSVNAFLMGYSGTLITNGFPSVFASSLGSGSCTINIINTNALNALSGTLTIGISVR